MDACLATVPAIHTSYLSPHAIAPLLGSLRSRRTRAGAGRNPSGNLAGERAALSLALFSRWAPGLRCNGVALIRWVRACAGTPTVMLKACTKSSAPGGYGRWDCWERAVISWNS